MIYDQTDIKPTWREEEVNVNMNFLQELSPLVSQEAMGKELDPI